uniref:Uncharacterized protein n=1 Tax=Melopsittacus undulatus TaxID=13146 RepID=A0A8V5GKL1_MELUD
MQTFRVIIKDTSIVLTQSHIKAYMLMTLQGLEYLHQHWILHRVSIPNRVYTHQVVPIPRIIVCARMYGVGVDMWVNLACVLKELFLMKDSSSLLPDYVTLTGDDLLNLLQGLFTFNPCTGLQLPGIALKQKYFSNRPGPTPGKSQVPRPTVLDKFEGQMNAKTALVRKVG